MKNEEKMKRIFGGIKSKDDALKAIKDASILFLVVAAIQGIIGIFISPGMIIDAIIFTVFALSLLKWKGRVVAVILLMISSVVIITTFLNRIGITADGGRNIFLAIIVFLAAIRAVEATFKLNSRSFEIERKGGGEASEV